MRYYFINCHCQNTAKNSAVETMVALVKSYNRVVITEDDLANLVNYWNRSLSHINMVNRRCGNLTSEFKAEGQYMTKYPYYSFAEMFSVTFIEINQMEKTVGSDCSLTFQPAAVSQLSLF